MLEFEDSWRFESPGEIPEEACGEFFRFAKTAARHADEQEILEEFKWYFAESAGLPCGRSSDAGWAETDLRSLMGKAAKSAPLFIEAFHDACNEVRQLGAPVPDVSVLNRVLRKHGTGFEIRSSRIVRSTDGPATVRVSAPSVSEQANVLIQRSLEESQRLLSAGKHRQAVQEVLWLMETVSTAFKGVDTPAGSVEGKYFVRIAKDLRRLHEGNTLGEVLRWVGELYGYLSSPGGGGIRHGTDIANPGELDEHEARLYCDLIQSYTQFLLATHERLGERTTV